MSAKIQLRGGASGPVLDGGNTGDVVTKNADGSVSFQPGGGSATTDTVANLSEWTGSTATAALNTIHDAPSFQQENNNGLAGSAPTINFLNGPAQRLVLSANAALIFSNLPANRTVWLQLKVVQGAGPYTLTITGAKTPGGAGLTLSAANGATDLVNVYWDGSALFASVAGLGFA